MDAVDKLTDMDIDINSDLLSIMMLYSLSPCYENFRVAIESRETLLRPKDLKIKIIEEAEARNKELHPKNSEDAFYSSKQKYNKFIPNNKYKKTLPKLR